MFNSDGDKLPRPETWQAQMLKAARYAACALDHPLYRLQAGKTGIGAYSLAFLDSLEGPQLIAVDSSRWTGGMRECIHFHLKETVRVMHLRIMIGERKTSKTLLEAGHAYVSRLNPLIWTFITKTSIPQTPGLCIDVLANDLAGNVGADSVVFNYE